MFSGGYVVKRKPFYGIAAGLSIVLLIAFYSYFWFKLGKSPMEDFPWDYIFMIIFLLILSIVSINFYKSPYHEAKKSITGILLYGIPFVLFWLLVLFMGDPQDPLELFPYLYTSGFGLNAIVYGLSLFVKE